MGISDLKKVVEELTPLPVIVLNSHTHNDHVGDNWEFSTILRNGHRLHPPQRARLEARRTGRNRRRSDLRHATPKVLTRRPTPHVRGKFLNISTTGIASTSAAAKLKSSRRPGHTPDAISLFDRANGLLFTGDTYYPAAIWLYRPETSLDSYAASIRRLAALAPEVKIVLGAHNFSGGAARCARATRRRLRPSPRRKSAAHAGLRRESDLQSRRHFVSDEGAACAVTRAALLGGQGMVFVGDDPAARDFAEADGEAEFEGAGACRMRRE